MNRIDRYVAGLFITYFLGALVAFTTLFVVFDAMNLMLNNEAVPLSVLYHYYLVATPDSVYKMLPIACLIATIFTLSVMNRNNELVALYASGMSLLRIASPVFLAVIGISSGAFFLADRSLPHLAKEKNYIYYRDIVKKPGLFSTTKANRIWYRSQDKIFFIKTLNEKTQTAQGLTLYYLNENWDLYQVITAKLVELKGETWVLHNGTVTVILPSESSFPLTQAFSEKTIVMDQDAKDLGKTGNTSELLTQSELAEFIGKNKAAGLDTLSYEVDYQAKYGFAFAALVMSLMAVPFCISRARAGGTLLSIGFGLALVVVYWIFYSSGITLGNHGRIPPILAAWLANILMGSAAYVSLRRLSV